MNWEKQLNELLKIYSLKDLALVLSISESRIREYLKSKRVPQLKTQLKIKNLLQSIQLGTDPRQIYFNSWSKKVKTYNLWLRSLRETLGMGVEKIAHALNVSPTYINRYESGEIKIPQSLGKKLEKFLYKRADQEVIRKAKELLKFRIAQIVRVKKLAEKINCITKLIPSFYRDRNYGSIYDILNVEFGNVFFGVEISLPILKDGKYVLDALVVNSEVFGFEIKTYESINHIEHKLDTVYNKLIHLKLLFPNIKFGLIVPFINVGEELKRKFRNAGLILLDASTDVSKIKELEKEENDIFKKLSYRQMIIILEKEGIKFQQKNLNSKWNYLYRFFKKESNEKERLLEIIKRRLDEKGQKLLFEINKELAFKNKKIVFLRNCRKILGLSLKDVSSSIDVSPWHLSSLEKGMEDSEVTIKKYENFITQRINLLRDNNLFHHKLKLSIRREKERWDKASFFDFVVNLREENDNVFEKRVFCLLESKGITVVRNVEVSDKKISVRYGGRFPEIDIVAKYEGTQYLIFCKNTQSTRASELLKNEIIKINRIGNLLGLDSFLVLPKYTKSIKLFGKFYNVNVVTPDELLRHFTHNTLYFISIGLSDEKDMSIKALEAAKSCDLLFVEFYTTKLNTTKEKLEELIGKPIRILSRKELEEDYQKIILDEAKTKKVGLLVGGDCFTATTHHIIMAEAIKQGIKTRVIHGSSIISAICETGLHIYKFGPCVTIPFPERTKGKLPESVYEVIKMNKARGLHTLCLLDVLAEENRYMEPREGLKILLEIEKKRKEGVISEESEAIIFSKVGSEKPLIVFGKIKNLIKKDIEIPAVIIFPGILHFTEKEFLLLYSEE
ncbi:MAG: diphthine synthase [Candidatus Aenigmatarchaeota archaeon]